MQRDFIISNLLRRIAVIVVIGLFCFSAPGCLIIGAKDGDVRDRVSKVESRLDSLERQYAASSPSLQNGQTDGFATSTHVANPQVANPQVMSKVAPRSRSL